MGTPALSGLLAVFVSSIFASSSLSASQESTTKIIPSVHLVYDFHKGRNFSCPPTSQTKKFTPRKQ